MTELFGIPMATCARKALHAVFEKSAPIQYREVERAYLASPEYRRLNPAGLVPVMVLSDSRTLAESSVIMRYVDDAYPGPRLQPADPYTRARMNLWLKWVDERYFGAISAITAATYIRSLLGTPLEEARLQKMLQSMTDPASRARREEAVRVGIESPAVRAALACLAELLLRIENTLKSDAWLAGSDYSLAESAVFPIVLRLQELGLESAWNPRLPRVTDWWKRLGSRQSTQRVLELTSDEMRNELRSSADAVRPGLLSGLSVDF
jgi:glutathione S-transferase